MLREPTVAVIPGEPGPIAEVGRLARVLSRWGIGPQIHVVDRPEFNSAACGANVDVDRAMWDWNPHMASPAGESSSVGKAGQGRFYQIAATKDFPGMAAKMKAYVVSRGSFLDTLAADSAIPGKPTLTYTLSVNGPVELVVSWTIYTPAALAQRITAHGLRRAADALVAAREGRVIDSSDAPVDGRIARTVSFAPVNEVAAMDCNVRHTSWGPTLQLAQHPLGGEIAKRLRANRNAR